MISTAPPGCWIAGRSMTKKLQPVDCCLLALSDLAGARQETISRWPHPLALAGALRAKASKMALSSVACISSSVTKLATDCERALHTATRVDSSSQPAKSISPSRCQDGWLPISGFIMPHNPEFSFPRAFRDIHLHTSKPRIRSTVVAQNNTICATKRQPPMPQNRRQWSTLAGNRNVQPGKWIP